MLDGSRISLKAQPAKPLPVEAMVLGKSCNEVADLLPRLFNLCRSAQSMAVRLALGLDHANDQTTLRQEIIRDHVLRLTVVLPGHFGRAPGALPADWKDGGVGLRTALFGPRGRLPDRVDAYRDYLHSGEGLSGLWTLIAALFPDGEAQSRHLPYVTTATAGDASAQVENSCASRVADHPVVSALGEIRRSMLWRVVARSYDLQALLDGAALPAHCPKPGVAHVGATRGLYTVMAQRKGAQVAAFSRVTPTDHLQAPGGVLDQTLASLPADRTALVPLIMDILDPCAPIRVEEVAHA